MGLGTLLTALLTFAAPCGGHKTMSVLQGDELVWHHSECGAICNAIRR